MIAASLIAGLAAKQLDESSSTSIPVPAPAARILGLLNARRAAAHLVPLKRDDVLASLARAHNRDMLAGDWFAHDSPLGLTFAQRMAHLHRRLVGETIAWGTGGFTTPTGIVSLWMASAPHRRIILTAAFRRVGISVLDGSFQGQDHARVATADFST